MYGSVKLDFWRGTVGVSTVVKEILHGGILCIELGY